MNKIKKFLIKVFKHKPTVELYKDEGGYYIIKCYGQYMTDTLTKSEEEANRKYNIVKDIVDGKYPIKEQLIKSNG